MTFERSRLADVLELQSNGKPFQQGWSPQCEPSPADAGAWGVLKTTAIQAGWFDDAQQKKLPTHLAPRPAIEVQEGDLLITCAGPRSRCGVPTLVRRTRDRLMLSGKMYRFRPRAEVDPRFLELWLLSPEAQSEIDEMKTGISDSGLNLTHGRFAELPVPTPVLGEQLRIVEILEDHLSRLDAGAQAINTADERLAGMRASQDLRATSTGPVHRLSSLLTSAGYGTSIKCAAGGHGLPVARIPNIVDGAIDMSDEKRAVDARVDLSSLRLKAGDVLLVRTNGSRDLIGRTAVVADDMEVAFASYLIRLVFDRSQILPEYAHLVLRAPRARHSLEALAASSAGQYNLGLKKLNGIEINVPSLTMQSEAVASARASDEAAFRIRQELRAQRLKAEALRRALLAAAFSGRLTGHASDLDRAEELASVSG